MGKYQTSARTRLALIDAAGQLAAEKGFNAISTRAIAQLAGENIGSIHYHFGGKEKLFEAVIHSVANRWEENPLDEVLASCDMATEYGQAEAIRRILRREVSLLFDKQMPSWYCRVIYQVMQFPNQLQDNFRAIAIDPASEQICKVFKTIDPTMDDETAELHFLLLLTPLFSHADYRTFILKKLGKTEYSSQYLQRLVDTCAMQTLLFFNLPTSEVEHPHDSKSIS